MLEAIILIKISSILILYLLFFLINVLAFDYSCIVILFLIWHLNGRIIYLKFRSYVAELRTPGDVDYFTKMHKKNYL